MMKKLWTLALLALLATPTQAQDVDTLYRAAYCVGVLKGEEWFTTTPEFEAILITTEELLCKRLNECGGALQREAKKQKRLHELRSKRHRYVTYVAARIIGTGVDAMVVALVEKGEREQVHGHQSGTSLRMAGECMIEAGWRYDEQQTHECLAKRDQGAANRYACVSMPDRLPF